MELVCSCPQDSAWLLPATPAALQVSVHCDAREYYGSSAGGPDGSGAERTNWLQQHCEQLRQPLTAALRQAGGGGAEEAGEAGPAAELRISDALERRLKVRIAGSQLQRAGVRAG